MNNYTFIKCRDILNKRNITPEEFARCERILTEYLKIDNKDNRIYELLGKLYLYKENIHKAKQNINIAIGLKETAFEYYTLFRINILEKNFVDAKINLNKYIEMHDNKNLNLELYKLLIDKCLNEENEYKIDQFFFFEELYGKNLVLYLNGVKSILEEDYSNAINLFNNLDKNAERQKIYISFKYVIKLLENLNIKKTYLNDEKFNEKIKLFKDYKWNDDYDNIHILIDEILSYNLTEQQELELIHQIPRLLNIDEYEYARKINSKVKKDDKNGELTRETYFYDRLINEMYEIYNLKGIKKEIFQHSFTTGMSNLHAEEYEKALKSFEDGLEKTNINLFNYYIGKTNYMLGNLKQARRDFTKYSDGGAYRISYCKHFLAILDYRFGKKGKAIKLDQDAEYFANLLNKPYKTKITYKQNDQNLEKLFETINITEEDFMKQSDKQKKKV